MNTALLQRPFCTLCEAIRHQATIRPQHPALVFDQLTMDYATVDTRIDRIAASLARDGIGPGAVVAICAANSADYVIVFLGALRAGAAAALLAPSANADGLAAMLKNAEAGVLFLDAAAADRLPRGAHAATVVRIGIHDNNVDTALTTWQAGGTASPPVPAIHAEMPFNLIYSSGTTGQPKGIVQSHEMRWAHIQRASRTGYDEAAITLVATPLYSNTTLVSFLPTLALGGTVILMAKFDTRHYLELAQNHRVTHSMLVPVQYRRLLQTPGFDTYDLSSFRSKYCTSAPFPAELKQEVVRRFPGALIEFYGMTEGGGTCELRVDLHPEKLHTVGRPAPGHDIRLIDDAGLEVGVGAAGEIVGHSPSMMNGYHRLPEASAEAEWRDASGKRFIRTGDVGRFDNDGFLVLLDRKKDMIISGGFNIYPSDLEAELRRHPEVADAAVVGIPSDRWGETPVAFVVWTMDVAGNEPALLEWTNARLGKTQRIHDVVAMDELPRSQIGKVLKRQLRDLYQVRH